MVSQPGHGLSSLTGKEKNLTENNLLYTAPQRPKIQRQAKDKRAKPSKIRKIQRQAKDKRAKPSKIRA